MSAFIKYESFYHAPLYVPQSNILISQSKNKMIIYYLKFNTTLCASSGSVTPNVNLCIQHLNVQYHAKHFLDL